MISIRRAELRDLDAITEIYNDAVVHSTATFDTTPKTRAEQLAWFEKHGTSHPIIVACEGDEVLGWASLSAWSDRCAYSETAEVSIYIKEGHRNQGLGRKLFMELDRLAQELKFHSLLSRITADSKASIHLHEVLGFRHVGVLKEVGRKFGRLLDVYMMQKNY